MTQQQTKKNLTWRQQIGLRLLADAVLYGVGQPKPKGK